MIGRFHALYCAAAVAAATPAQAANDWVASAQMFGGVSGGRGVCYFTNLGTSSITIRNFAIRSNTSTITLVINECGSASGATLSAGRSCAIAINTGDDIPYNCEVQTTNKAVTRGNFELRGPNPPQTIIESQALE